MDYFELLRTVAYILSTWNVEHPTWVLYEGGAPIDPTAEEAEIQRVTFAAPNIEFNFHGRQPNDFPSLLIYHRQDTEATPGSTTARRIMQLEMQVTTKISSSRAERLAEYEWGRAAILRLIKALRSSSIPSPYQRYLVPGGASMTFLGILAQGSEDLCGAQCVLNLQRA